MFTNGQGYALDGAQIRRSSAPPGPWVGQAGGLFIVNKPLQVANDGRGALNVTFKP